MTRLIFIIAFMFAFEISGAQLSYQVNASHNTSTTHSVLFDPNNISSWFQTSGTFNRDTRTPNAMGLMWPKNSGKFLMVTSGLSLAAIVDDQLRMAAASYKGEFSSGYIEGAMPSKDSTFKIYKVTKGDNGATNPDHANWHLMIPYGAPFADVNSNGLYDQNIDIPGVKNAEQTIFMVITDGFMETHNASEGFGGGTQPLMSQISVTAWGYNHFQTDLSYLNDVQFIRYNITNKGTKVWNNVYFGMYAATDVGYDRDDYTGYDSSLNLGYCYNKDSSDFTYGISPPSVGMKLIKGPNINEAEHGLSSFVVFKGHPYSAPCEMEPVGEPVGAYFFMQGLKKTGYWWVNRITMQPTKYLYTGDPETNKGWTEFKGCVIDCYGSGGFIITQNAPLDATLLLNAGSEDLDMHPGEHQELIYAQMVAKGSSNLNSVTKLKELARITQQFYDSVSSIVTPILPPGYELYQNYPNPFNPNTTIKFDIPDESAFVSLIIYDITGRKLSTLIDQRLVRGTYEKTFDGSNLASGVYFYELRSGNFVQTRKMLLIK